MRAVDAGAVTESAVAVLTEGLHMGDEGIAVVGVERILLEVGIDGDLLGMGRCGSSSFLPRGRTACAGIIQVRSQRIAPLMRPPCKVPALFGE